ncbi:hypothetical protein FHS27_001741 [Rhodopirellula rubra]|uniref:Uncharacterized protein n=1 Tax=Aporhodopirellula rubra TaxID=980271 RepID=A0A7W5DXL7_9BACT|nr:hypothetical protein [Aporhodopirellula rubra]MBB3205933.1 hypothetical protein [Aporhodopirellula rubra]
MNRPVRATFAFQPLQQCCCVATKNWGVTGVNDFNTYWKFILSQFMLQRFLRE